MNRFAHVLFHVGAVILQVGVAATPFIPPPWNVAAIAGIATIQGVVALKNHPKNPPPATSQPEAGDFP